jgi:pectate lyase
MKKIGENQPTRSYIGQRRFTVPELMVVLSIFVVLVGVTVPIVAKTTGSGKADAMVAKTETVQVAMNTTGTARAVTAGSGPVPAFPGAEGWGAEAVGGRGGQIGEVTNLNDRGLGSLRACVNASVPRTCVFRVAGIINLESPLRIQHPYITIAGQTAPGDGITLQGAGFTISTHDVIIRYIHWRSETLSFISIVPWDDAHNIIIDHCSANGHKPGPRTSSGTMIQGFYEDNSLPKLPDIRNITIQNCLLAENMRPVAIATGGRTDMSVSPPLLDNHRMNHISIYRNYMASSGHRNPKLGTPNTEV